MDYLFIGPTSYRDPITTLAGINLPLSTLVEMLTQVRKKGHKTAKWETTSIKPRLVG
jgi:hypothetical protein